MRKSCGVMSNQGEQALDLFGAVAPRQTGWIRIAGLGRLPRQPGELKVPSPCRCAAGEVGAVDADAVNRYADRVRAGDRLDVAVCRASGCPQRKVLDEVMALAYPTAVERFTAYAALIRLCEANALLRKPGDECAKYLDVVRAKRGAAAADALSAMMLAMRSRPQRSRR